MPGTKRIENGNSVSQPVLSCGTLHQYLVAPLFVKPCLNLNLCQATPLRIINGTLMCHEIPVGNHCSREMNTMNFTRAFTHSLLWNEKVMTGRCKVSCNLRDFEFEMSFWLVTYLLSIKCPEFDQQIFKKPWSRRF